MFYAVNEIQFHFVRFMAKNNEVLRLGPRSIRNNQDRSHGKQLRMKLVGAVPKAQLTFKKKDNDLTERAFALLRCDSRI
jgi:hypothetical protein